MFWWTLRKLNSRNGLRRQAAITELEQRRDSDHLAGVLSSGRYDVPQQAALALARLEDRRAVPELIRMAQQVPNVLFDPAGPYYKSSALKALCKLGDAGAVATVVDQLGLLNVGEVAAFFARFREDAIPLLEKILRSPYRPASELREATQHREALDKSALILQSLGWAPPPGRIRILYLILLGKYDKPSPQDIPHLTKLCRHNRAEVRLKVAEAFQKLHDPRAAEGLGQLLEASNKSVWEEGNSCEAAWETAIVALRQIGDGMAVVPLINVLRNPESDFRKEAVVTLGLIGDARAVEPLVEAVKNREIRFRWDAAAALSQIRDPRGVEPLVRALNDPESLVRKSAATALGGIKDAKAVDPLLCLLHDTDLETQELAAKALGEIGDARALQPLRDLIHRDHESPIVGKYNPLRVPVAAIESLGRINDPGAIQAIGEALLHEYPRIVDAAATVLTSLNNPCAVGPLLIWARHRQHGGGPPEYAERAIKQLCQLLDSKAGELSSADLHLISQIGEIRQADWGGTGDDYGWSGRDSHVVDTGHLLTLTQQEIRHRAARR